MTRRKKQIRYQQGKQKLDLDNITDTSETASDDQKSTIRRRDPYDEFVEVPPPFKAEKEPRFITWSEISLTYKIIAIACAIFITVGVPSVWFASRLDTNVENLKENVVEIKQTTKQLVETSIYNSNRVSSLEKDVSNINKQVDKNRQELTKHEHQGHSTNRK